MEKYKLKKNNSIKFDSKAKKVNLIEIINENDNFKV